MKHIKAIAIKFVSTLVLLYIVLGVLNGVAFRNVFLISLILGIAAYVIGDMMILPRTNNTMATLADFGLAFLVIWVMSEYLTYGESMLGEAFTAAIGVAIFEYLFHRYLANQVLETVETRRFHNNQLQYQTEASEELTPVRPDVRSEDDEM
jgi:hypothetical protein